MRRRFKIEFEVIKVHENNQMHISFDCGDTACAPHFLLEYADEIVPEYVTGEWYWVKLEETDVEHRPARYLDIRNGFYLDGRFHKADDLYEVSEMCTRPLIDD